MTPKIWTFTVCRNEAQMAPWFLRHYAPWVERMVIWDENSTDGTRQILKACPQVDLREWPFRGLDDDKFLLLANEWYKTARGQADLVAIVDMDELLYRPDMLKVLTLPHGDIYPATGYALINPDGWPHDDGRSQIYELVRTGLRQENYDKQILFDPNLDVQHTYGRHTYPGQWPRHNGELAHDVGIKLLHLHHIGGVCDTEFRNHRNYDAAVNKKFAWNYHPDHNKPEQVGTVAWVEDAIENHRLIDVMEAQHRPGHQFQAPTPTVPTPEQRPHWIQFGTGPHPLPPPWSNFDMDCDIRKPLPFANDSTQYIYASHVIEHVTHREAWRFLEECFRILKPGGVVRIAIPDIMQCARRMNREYAEAVKAGGHGDGTPQSAIKAMVFEHGHQAAWNADLLETFMASIGFDCDQQHYGFSRHAALLKIESHGKSVGEGVARTETAIVEGTK